MSERKRGSEEDFFDLGEELAELEDGAPAEEVAAAPASEPRAELEREPRKPSSTPNRPLYLPPQPGEIVPRGRARTPSLAERSAPPSPKEGDESASAAQTGEIPAALLLSLHTPSQGEAPEGGGSVSADEPAGAPEGRAPASFVSQAAAAKQKARPMPSTKSAYVPPPPPTRERPARPSGEAPGPKQPMHQRPGAAAPATQVGQRLRDAKADESPAQRPGTPARPGGGRPAPSPRPPGARFEPPAKSPRATPAGPQAAPGMPALAPPPAPPSLGTQARGATSALPEAPAVEEPEELPLEQAAEQPGGLDELDDDLDLLLGAPSDAPRPAPAAEDPEAAESEASGDEPELLVPEDPDEPELLVPEDPDEPELLVPEDPDEDIELELGEGEEGSEEAVEAAEPEAVDDRGAEAAKRTVRQRKPRTEILPLVGTHPEAQKARLELLLALAEQASGAQRARLLTSAAELCERAGDPRALELLGQAHEADPGDLHLLRALRREALARGDCDEAARLLALEVERAPSEDERSLALCLLAELELHQLGRADDAEEHARRAQALRPRALVPALLIAEAAGRRSALEAAGDALAEAAEAVGGGPLGGALFLEAARLAERAGAHGATRSRYEGAVEADPAALGALLGMARRRLREGDGRTTAALLARAREALAGEHEELERLQARVLALREGAHEEAARLLESARTPLGALARADAARATRDREGAILAYAAAATGLGGRDRALSLLSIAELSAEAGAFAEADRALREAAHADPGLALVQAVREAFARFVDDPTVLPISTQDDAEHAARIGAAARALAFGRLDEELAAIGTLEEAAPLIYETLGPDAAAAAGDAAAVALGLRKKADRRAPSARVGSLLALASVLARYGDGRGAEGVLREARELSPGDPLILRSLAENAGPGAPFEAAALRLEESAASGGEAGAFAATWAARLLERGGADPSSAYRRALHAAPGYLPAVVGLLPFVEAFGTHAEARELHRAAARRIEEPRRAAVHLASAIELSLGETAMLPELIRDLTHVSPGDPALLEIALVLEGLDPALRASILEGGVMLAGDGVRKALRLAAARAREREGAFDAAAELYRAAVDEDGDFAAQRGLERAELAGNQLARLAETRVRAMRAATNESERRLALEGLAELDLHHRADPMKALLSLESVREIDPTDLPTLRALERIYMDADAVEEVARIAGALIERLEGADAAGAARFRAALLLPTEQGGSELDDMWILAARRGAADTGVRRRIYGAAARKQEPGVLYETLASLSRESADPASRLWYALRAGAEAEGVGKSQEAAERLEAAIEECPGHPTASEELARLYARAGNLLEAAERLEAAAEMAEGPARKARLWYAASSIWLDRIGDAQRGLIALESTMGADITYLDAYDRSRELLVSRGDLPRALRLTQARIAAGGAPAQLAQLEAVRADLCERLGDSEGASEALRAAIELAPDDLRTLRRLAELHLRTENHASAADALIRIARKEQDREVLRWVFMMLGDLYDRHLPDPKRADVAFRRVLKLSPGDEEALDRLAILHLRAGELAEVEGFVAQLFDFHPESARARERSVEFAAALEARGEDRLAEQVLDRARRAAPTDIALVRALADFYQRQSAVSALSVHLARAAADHRREVDEHPDQAKGWWGLAQVLSLGGQEDASRCVAMAAIALGVRDVTLARLVDASGNVPGARGAAVGPEIEEILAPRLLPGLVRQAIRLAGPVFHKVLPFDPKAFRAERLRGHPLADEAERIARELRVPDVQVLVTDLAPRICVPVSDEPAIIVVGRELSSVTTQDERAFLFARALQIARTGLSVTMRAQPRQIALLMTALSALFDPMVRRDGIEPALLDDASKRLARAMPRRLRSDLEPIFRELAARPDVDTSKLGLAVADFGNRLGLLTTGALGSALSALVRLAGRELGEPDPAARAGIMRSMSETWALLHFSISDAHFEARRRALSERRW